MQWGHNPPTPAQSFSALMWGLLSWSQRMLVVVVTEPQQHCRRRCSGGGGCRNAVAVSPLPYTGAVGFRTNVGAPLVIWHCARVVVTPSYPTPKWWAPR
ncbi:hypothetical protein GALMADRAFT_239738 [Galerina marginata CBS 339.88]|uniref:Secreted protein n=1 Tax=Galerina marginata (strain CBS 339.88) TaxID=685588 RepID=A0A067TP05_GALM3|nr:hypothetical protein GALMADRAFT_239738 [Galerina marginata CBS 339.88]